MNLPKDLRSQLEELGLETLGARTTKHVCLRLRNRHGVTGTIVVAKTPSDHRAILNLRARLRRFAKKT